jgi:uncharacterized membrane protein YczE
MIIGCVILLAWGALSIAYSVIGSVVLNNDGADANVRVANPIGLAVGISEVVLFILGVWGAARLAKIPLILFAILSMLLIGLNIAAMVVYLVAYANRYFVVEFIWYILSIAFLIILFIISLILSRRSRHAC